MKVPANLSSTYEFACHSAACAPPPAGSGGSNPGKAAAIALHARNRANAEHYRNKTGPFTRVSDLTATGFMSRKEMPQFTGVPRVGSKADALPRTDHGTVHAFDAFAGHMKARGIKVTEGTAPAKSLKASQNELDFGKMSSMAATPSFDAKKVPVLVSKDGYVIDGHHRWGAQMIRDRSGAVATRVVDLPARELIREAQVWTKAFGLEPKN
jgi:hypothetical protein